MGAVLRTAAAPAPSEAGSDSPSKKGGSGSAGVVSSLAGWKERAARCCEFDLSRLDMREVVPNKSKDIEELKKIIETRLERNKNSEPR